MNSLLKSSSTGFFIIVLLFISCSEDSKDTEPETTYIASISTINTSASESDPGTGFTIELDKINSEGSALTVNFSISGTATAGTDFQSPSNATSVTISDGDQSAEVQIPFIDDSEVEDDETIVITLSASTIITLGTSSSVTITIADNDTDGGTCPNDNSTNQNNWDCDETPHTSNSYSESISGNILTITTNGIPNHDFRNQIPNQVDLLNSSTKTFNLTTNPQVAGSSTNIVDDNYMPAYDFGLAKNGVPIDPAPGMPFIFENTQTGEYNWDWVMEPNNNMEGVGLDCAIAHVQPDGTYHYHGDMAVYADLLLDGLGSGTTTPNDPVQIGWAADGFPVLYKFGPDASGTIKELSPSYQIKSGDRPGDGVSEPCDVYNGKYTNDYEFVSGLGDLDECNGAAKNVTIGNTTYDYFYVITSDFPVIPRCISGTPDNSFKKN